MSRRAGGPTRCEHGFGYRHAGDGRALWLHCPAGLRWDISSPPSTRPIRICVASVRADVPVTATSHRELRSSSHGCGPRRSRTGFARLTQRFEHPDAHADRGGWESSELTGWLDELADSDSDRSAAASVLRHAIRVLDVVFGQHAR